MGNVREVSKDTLTQSLERRMKHVMVQLLKQFEERFPNLEESQEGRLFKFDIKNQFNDAIRATRDEVRDYDIQYRPIRFNADNTLSITKAFIEGIEHISFHETNPGMKMLTSNSPENYRILEAIRKEMGVGVIYQHNDGRNLTFTVCGLDNCVNMVIPFMDLYRLFSSVQAEYLTWRSKIVDTYIGR